MNELAELALVFLRLGTTAFGGPAAHIAMMEHEFVRRRAWLTHEQFLDLVGAASLIPGPSSTEVAIYVGYRRGGWRGLLIAGICFIVPAALIVTAIAWTYVRVGRLPAVEGVLYGIKPAILAVVLQAIGALGRSALKSKGLLAIGLVAAVANALGGSPLLVLLGAGLAALAARASWRSQGSAVLLLSSSPFTSPTLPVGSAGFAKLFLIFAKLGAVVFGSGYVLLAFLRAEFVERTHLLTEAQLLDAVAVGQFTPGPVFTTATFIGYLLRGFAGALVATLGIFLPSFVLVSASGPLLPRLRQSTLFSSFLDGVNVASLALMAVVTVHLARAAIVDIPTALMATASAVSLLFWRVNSAWLVLLGGLAGALVRFAV